MVSFAHDASVMANLRFLLLQIRDPGDPIRAQEVRCFADVLDCAAENIETLDLLTQRVTATTLDRVDAVLIGGSGDYSAAGESSPWLENVLTDLRRLCDSHKPTFASCWGFQAIARALGGRCIHDPQHAELGTIELELTQAATKDPLFEQLENPLLGLAGHEDHVVELPAGAILLASSKTVTNQAFKLADAPVYCTQFHPELDLTTFLDRVAAYPQYVEKIARQTIDTFAANCRDTPQARQLLRDFVKLVTTLQSKSP